MRLILEATSVTIRYDCIIVARRTAIPSLQWNNMYIHVCVHIYIYLRMSTHTHVKLRRKSGEPDNRL